MGRAAGFEPKLILGLKKLDALKMPNLPIMAGTRFIPCCDFIEWPKFLTEFFPLNLAGKKENILATVQVFRIVCTEYYYYLCMSYILEVL
jgi:hypothetical protein